VPGGEPRIGGGAGNLGDVTDGTPARAIPLDKVSGRCILQIDYAKPDRLRHSRTALHRGKQSGYDMRKTIQGSVGYFWGESYGQIYPMLRRLTAEGLIAQSGRGGKGRGGRREYSLTAAGHARLQEWLAVPYRMDPPRDEFLLKLFFGPRGRAGRLGAPRAGVSGENRRVLATIEEIGRLGGNGTRGIRIFGSGC